MSRPRGFTLVEMMVALVMLSMITVATIAAMRTLGNTRGTLEQVTARVDEVRAVSEFLRSALGSAMPVLRLRGTEGYAEQGSTYGTYFLGDRRQVTWVAPLLAGADLGGVFVMHLARVDDRLELRYQPYRPEATALDWGELRGRVLLEGVEKVEFGYLPHYDAEWVADWPGAQRNPVALRLNLRTAGRYWPELVIPLDGAGLNLR